MTGPPTQRPGTLAHPAAAQRSRQTTCTALLVAITFFMETLDATVIANAAWPCWTACVCRPMPATRCCATEAMGCVAAHPAGEPTARGCSANGWLAVVFRRR
ncbi:hypothetical protein GEV39_14295 [Pseudomonas sp. NY5710]|nr:hypothetical protein GEV39_14295 [Pseudomonas sp. NY5710]